MTMDELFRPNSPDVFQVRTRAKGPAGTLPLDANMLLEEPSGNIFGLTQDAGMGWNPEELRGKRFLILSTQGGLREASGQPIALGFRQEQLQIWQIDY